MANSTTQSLWRSGGGDPTRTAYNGSTVLSAQFFANLTAEDDLVYAYPLIWQDLPYETGYLPVPTKPILLPPWAIVTEIQITIFGTGTGAYEIGAGLPTGYNSGPFFGLAYYASSIPFGTECTINAGSTYSTYDAAVPISIYSVIYGDNYTGPTTVTITPVTPGNNGLVVGTILYTVADAAGGQ